MADDDAYAQAVRGKLKLKTDGKAAVDNSKKKKKKKKSKKEVEERMRQGAQEELAAAKSSRAEQVASEQHITKAELAFRKMQERMQEKRIMEKASTTHKQRVEKFNQHLDNLTEFYDIPKVSWTK